MFWLHGRSRQSSSWADEGTAGGPRFKNASDRKAAREMKSGGLPVVSPRGSHSSVLVACWLALTLATVHAQSPSNAPFVVPDTAFPSTSVEPTSFPSSSTAGDGSTGTPSSIPSDMPSDMPSNSPTPQPSLEEPSLASARFRQEFAVGNGRLFTESEIVLFQGLYGSYTSAFAPSSVSVDDEIISECEFLSQKLAERALSVAARHHHFTRSRQLQQSTLLQVDFNMVYASPYTNVSAFPLLFQSYVNAGLEQVAQQMQILGLNVSAAFIASRIIIRPDPTVQPTIAPSLQPSLSHSPSGIPSDMATLEPSSSTVPSASAPSSAPTMNPAPNQQGPKEASKGSGKIVISISVVVAMIIVMIGLFVYYRKKKNDRKLAFQSSAPGNRKGSRDDTVWDHSSQKQVDNEAGNHTEAQLNVTTSHKRTASAKSASRTEAIILHNDSLVSNQSLLSTGDSKAEDSGDEVDATHYLADEFDQYKDQNLEKMRAGVEGNLTGFDGMMSQALTRALIDEDDSNIDPTELLWGGSGRLLGAEIEASALGEVTDWLKRKQAPTDDERYVLSRFSFCAGEGLGKVLIILIRGF